MAKRDKWTPESAETVLMKSKVKISNKIIEVRGGQLGLKGLGALSYLENYCNYLVKWIKA